MPNSAKQNVIDIKFDIIFSFVKTWLPGQLLYLCNSNEIGSKEKVLLKRCFIWCSLLTGRFDGGEAYSEGILRCGEGGLA